jgi:hypothetical protein
MTLESTFEYFEQIIKESSGSKAEEGNKSFYLLIEADNQLQAENNMDNVLKLWKYYIPLLKKSFTIQREIAYRLHDCLHTYVLQGLQSMTTNPNSQQVGMKLQLLNYFLQRLCATLIYLQSHFTIDHISSCFLHLYCFQGFLHSNSTFLATYETKLKELYLKFFDQSFLLSLGKESFERILFSISSKLVSHLASGSWGLSTLIGTLHFASADLNVLEASTEQVPPLRINAYLEIYINTISLLATHYCGLISDSTISRYVTQLGVTVSNIILKMHQISASTTIPDTILVRICIPASPSLFLI